MTGNAFKEGYLAFYNGDKFVVPTKYQSNATKHDRWCEGYQDAEEESKSLAERQQRVNVEQNALLILSRLGITDMEAEILRQYFKYDTFN